MGTIGGELAGIGIGIAQHAACELHHHDLHSQADAKVGDLVLTGILCSLDHTLNAAVTKAAGHNDAVHVSKHFFAGILIDQSSLSTHLMST